MTNKVTPGDYWIMLNIIKYNRKSGTQIHFYNFKTGSTIFARKKTVPLITLLTDTTNN
jgi:hypothetical protein